MAHGHHLSRIVCPLALFAACSGSSGTNGHAGASGGRDGGLVATSGGSVNDRGGSMNAGGTAAATGGTGAHSDGGTSGNANSGTGSAGHGTTSNAGANNSGGGGSAGHGATANGGAVHGDAGQSAGSANRGGTDPSKDGGIGGTGGEDAGVAGSGDPCKTDPGDDDFDHASGYTLGTELRACISSGSDVDYYRFTTPNHTVDGYVMVSVSDIVERYMNLYTNEFQVDLYAGSDTHSLFNVWNDSSGSDINLWFAAAPERPIESGSSWRPALPSP